MQLRTRPQTGTFSGLAIMLFATLMKHRIKIFLAGVNTGLPAPRAERRKSSQHYCTGIRTQRVTYPTSRPEVIDGVRVARKVQARHGRGGPC